MQHVKIWIILSSLFFLAAEVYAQQHTTFALDHPLTPVGGSSLTPNNSAIRAFPETLRVLAAMVEFQTDNDDRTSGDGHFDLTVPSPKIIDPPPHNKGYVQNHLSFIENYFKKISDGKLLVQGTVLDSIYRLAQPMRNYSPSRSSIANIELGRLMEDSWRLVDSLNKVWHAADSNMALVQFDRYDAFVLLHAGVGRDVDMVSLYGYDPTPFDIPSIYLNLPGLRKMFGAPYTGVPVGNGSFHITNSIIIPETENRELQSFTGTVLVQLGINGLLAASIGSHLGLPDLFNTKNGASGIGRFGLMDGQSIFSWNGYFPPEMSAWEKLFLGWIHPITISSGDTVYTLPAVSKNTPDTVYRVLISEKEYFLIENRNRDANRDSARITMVMNGDTTIKAWIRDTLNFNAYDQDSLYGVIIDVDEFDWSLPGGVNTKTGEWFDGGILIWHVDENVIDANYADDRVNADPNRRGVDLEEADGSQDIGQSYGFLTAGSGSEDGTPLDFWYQGNRAPLRITSNEFNPSSYPNSLSNDGANSHVYIKGFSPRGPVMTARIQVGDDQVKMLPGFPKNRNYGFGNNSIAITNIPGFPSPIIFATYYVISAWDFNGNPLDHFASDGTLAGYVGCGGIVDPFNMKPVLGDFNKDSILEVAVSGQCWVLNGPYYKVPFVSSWTLLDRDNDSLADRTFYINDRLAQVPTTSIGMSDTILAVGGDKGGVMFIGGHGDTLSTVQIDASDTTNIVGLNRLNDPDVFLAVSKGGRVSLLTRNSVRKLKNYSTNFNSPAAVGFISSKFGVGAAFSSVDGYVYLVDSMLETQKKFPIATGGQIFNAPALADMDGDGQRDIIVFSGNKIFAINSAGSILDNYPVTVPTSKPILTSPIVADIDGNGTMDIVAVTQEGLVVAYDKTGKTAIGFPILAGPNGGSTPAAFYMPGACLSCTDIGLALASDDGYVYAWKTGTQKIGIAQPPEMPWPQYLHDAQNTGLVETPISLNIQSEFFPSSRAYNWPNPVGRDQGYKTHIRYFIGEDSKVSIKIFDMAGDVVASFDGPGIGGFDNETEWDVSNIQSGVYFAHIDAQGSTQHGVAIIKIAVVK